MKSYSYAGPTRGVTDPDNVYVVNVDEGCGHLTIIWSGNGYSRRNSWIIGEREYVVNLEEHR